MTEDSTNLHRGRLLEYHRSRSGDRESAASRSASRCSLQFHQ